MDNFILVTWIGTMATRAIRSLLAAPRLCISVSLGAGAVPDWCGNRGLERRGNADARDASVARRRAYAHHPDPGRAGNHLHRLGGDWRRALDLPILDVIRVDHDAARIFPIDLHVLQRGRIQNRGVVDDRGVGGVPGEFDFVWAPAALARINRAVSYTRPNIFPPSPWLDNGCLPARSGKTPRRRYFRLPGKFPSMARCLRPSEL